MRPVSRQDRLVATEEVWDGVAHWLDTPLSREGIHRERQDEFYIETTPDPLDRERFLDHVREHVAEHWERLLPIMLPGDDAPHFNEALAMLELDGEAVRRLNLGYRIRPAKLTEEPRFFMQADAHPDGRLAVEDGVLLGENVFSTSDLLALDFMSRQFRRDETREKRRYFFRPEQRYIAANDAFAGEDLADLEPLSKVVTLYFRNVIDNIRTGSMIAIEEAGYDQRPDRETLQRIMAEKTDREPGFKDLMIRRFSGLVLLLQAEGRGKPIASAALKRTGELSDKPALDLWKFDLRRRNTSYDWLDFMVEAEDPYPGLKGARSDALDADFIYHPVTEAGVVRDINHAMKMCVQDYLAERAALADARIAPVFKKYVQENSPDTNSPLFFMIEHLGPERADRLLSQGEAGHLLAGYEILRSTDYPIRELSDSDLRERLGDAYEIFNHRIWHHVLRDDPELIERRQDLETDLAENYDALDRRRAELYDRAETILRRAKRLVEVRDENDFIENNLIGSTWMLQEKIKTNWDMLDFDTLEVPEQRIIEAFANCPDVIAWMVEEYQRIEDPDKQLDADARRALRSRFIEGLARAIPNGYDPRMVVYVENVEAHLRSFAAPDGERIAMAEPREADDALEIATGLLGLLNSFPKARDGVEQIEEHAFFLHAGQMLDRFGKNPIERLRKWRAERDPEWDELLPRPIESIQQLEYEMWLTDQWGIKHHETVKKALRLVGHKTVRQLFRVAFPLNALDAIERSARWAESDTGLPPEALRGILSSVKTERDFDDLDELLPQYRLADDALAEEFGPPRSIRTLKSRLSYDPKSAGRILGSLEVDPRWREIMAAPGFDFGRLVEFMDHPEFKALASGELNPTQPFPSMAAYFFRGSLEQSLSDALGSRRQGIPGTARRPKKLFHDLKQLLRSEGSELSVTDLLEKVPLEIRREVVKVIEAHEQQSGELIDYMVAELHHKSDPAGWVSGNFTDCCIPFGRSLNNDYMLNPATQYFTVRYQGRPVAQSVVVDCRDRRTGRKAIVLDTIEIANNYRDQRGVIEDLYLAFWKNYYPNRKLLVGAMNGDPKLGATKRVEDPTRYEPEAPLDYSDAWRFDMYEVDAA
jgi:hypothetical protein